MEDMKWTLYFWTDGFHISNNGNGKGIAEASLNEFFVLPPAN